MLTEDQCAYFNTFGFIAVRQLFPPDEMEVIIREFEAALREDRDGQSFDGKERQTVGDWFRERSAVKFLIDDERVHAPIEQLLGPGYSMMLHADGNFYVGDTPWHPDQGWDPKIPEGKDDPHRLDGLSTTHYIPSIKVAFYLDPVEKETGCLRVIPGAHRGQFHEQLWSLHKDVPANVENFLHVRPKMIEMWERDTGGLDGVEEFLIDPDTNHFGLVPSDVPSFAIESEPGDAVFFSHQLWHASFGGKVGRRMFTLNFREAQSDDGNSS